MPAAYQPIRVFGLAPGAFFVLAMLTAIQNKVKRNLEAKGKDASKIAEALASVEGSLSL